MRGAIVWRSRRDFNRPPGTGGSERAEKSPVDCFRRSEGAKAGSVPSRHLRRRRKATCDAQRAGFAKCKPRQKSLLLRLRLLFLSYSIQPPKNLTPPHPSLRDTFPSMGRQRDLTPAQAALCGRVKSLLLPFRSLCYLPTFALALLPGEAAFPISSSDART